MKNNFRAAARFVIINKNNEILIVRQKNNWAIPWWWIDFGESIFEAISREAFEELWVKAKAEKIVFIQDFLWKWKWEDTQMMEYFCSIKNNKDFENIIETYKSASHSFELIEVKWCSLDDFPEDFLPSCLVEVLARYFKNKEEFSCEYVSGIEKYKIINEKTIQKIFLRIYTRTCISFICFWVVYY